MARELQVIRPVPTELLTMQIRFLVMILFTLAAVPGFSADAFSVGVKTGVPITDIVQTEGEIGGRPFHANVSRFVIGPVFDFRLPKGFGLEVGAMYKRFDQQAGQIQVTAGPGVPLQIESLPYTSTGQSWEFPILGQYRFGHGTVRPYLESGVSLNSLRNVFAPFRLSITSPQSASFKPGGDSVSRTGFVAGAGVEVKLRFARLSPGIRFTRYGAARGWLPSVASVDFLLGITF